MTGMQAAPAGPVFERGNGVWLWDDAGRRYIDGTSGLWNVNCGYGHPAVTAAIEHQLRTLAFGSLWGGRLHRPALDLAAALLDVGPIRSGRVFFTNSGGSAVDTALKVARRYHRLTGRPERSVVAGLVDAYHGSSTGVMAVTHQPIGQEEYGTDLDSVRHVGHDDAAGLDRLDAGVDHRLAAIVVEPVLGNGAHALAPDFVAGLHDVRDRTGCLLVVDEVATGFGRTGTLFACEQLGLEPDIVTLSKGITSGYLPMGATVCSSRVCDAFDDAGIAFEHGETQSGNPVACAAALATLAVMGAPGFLERVRLAGAHLQGRLDDLVGEPSVTARRGLGLMQAVDLATFDGRPFGRAEVGAVVAATRAEGALVYGSPAGVALLPPLTITDAEIDHLVDCLARGIDRAGL
jgi:adenosylmethionine-8-amino-7-oxononanoate aminotransferase